MADKFNAAEFLVGKHLAAGDGDRVAVIGTTTVTYAELDALVRDVAAAYRAAGLHGDDRIVLVMSDDVPMLSSIIAAFHAGFVAVPVSTMLTGSELGKILADSGTRIVMATSEFADAVQEAVALAPEVEQVVMVGGATPVLRLGASLVSWSDFVKGGRANPELRGPADTDEDAWALWLYTSGTTGLPKAAMHRHANIRYVCETYGKQVLGITRDDRTFSIAKLFFAYGIGNGAFFPLSVGATSILEPGRPTPALVQERLERDQPTLFFGVPTFYAGLLASDLPAETFASVRLGTSAGESLPAPLLTRFKERFGVDILDGIGSTEALHIFLSNRPGDIRPGTTGRAVPGYEIKVCDLEGAPVEPGTPGALWVKGASIALGYWRRADASRQVFRGEWLVTGDSYVSDTEGYYTCLGRNSDILKAGGIWVSPSEVESRLLEHPAVSEAAVVGIADANGLDKPVAAVVRAHAVEVEEAELIGWCRDGLAHFKAPRHIVFVDELPKTATGKVQRFKVRDLLTREAPAEVPA